eukprot:854368-Rhodomonas_salina.1
MVRHEKLQALQLPRGFYSMSVGSDVAALLEAGSRASHGVESVMELTSNPLQPMLSEVPQ